MKVQVQIEVIETEATFDVDLFEGSTALGHDGHRRDGSCDGAMLKGGDRVCDGVLLLRHAVVENGFDSRHGRVAQSCSCRGRQEAVATRSFEAVHLGQSTGLADGHGVRGKGGGEGHARSELGGE
eukprot:scaffold421244_cov58-Attheya_sp.AAC.9